MKISSNIGFSYLICAIIRITAQDIQLGNEYNRKTAIDFVESDWFIDICDELSLNPSKVKYMIYNTKVRSRVHYD